MENSLMFEKLPPGRLFLRCAVPSMISMAVTSLYTVADGIFVGRFVGAGALAAINLVMPFVMISFALADMVAAGSSVQIAIRLGEGKKEEASRIFSFACALIVGISCAVGLLGWNFADPLIGLLGADDSVSRYAVDYMKVYAAFSPLIMIFFAVDNYLRICGKVHYSMMMNVGISLANIALDWLFIVEFGGGTRAAALASCLSLTAGTFIGFLPFLRGKLELHFVRRARLSLKAAGNMLANGSSEFFANISGSVCMAIINAVLMGIAGAMGVAALSIVMYVDSIVSSMLYGMADSMQPAISYNYGAGNRKRMISLEKRLMGAGALIAVVTMVFLLVGGEHIIPFFLGDGEEELYAMSVRAMKIFSISYLVSWFGVIAGSFFTAMNRPVQSLAVSFSQTLVFPVASLIVLPRIFGLDGVWLSSFAGDLLTALLAGVLMIVVYKKLRGEGNGNQTTEI